MTTETSSTQRQPTTRGGGFCPVCHNAALPRIDLGEYRLFECTSCRSWSSDAAAVGASSSFEPDGYFENSAADHDKWERLMQQLGGLGKPLSSVLDIGCGTGNFLEWIHEREPGLEIEGIELDPGRSQLARERNPGARIHSGDALENVAQQERRFDLITLWDVFEHVPEPARLLDQLAQRVTPGGCVYIQTIHEHSLVPTVGRMSYWATGGRLRYGVRRTHEAHHLVFFSQDGLARSTRHAGFETRIQWFDRLSHARMDGPPWLTRLTSAALVAENTLGNGLFINLLLDLR